MIPDWYIYEMLSEKAGLAEDDAGDDCLNDVDYGRAWRGFIYLRQ